MALKKENTSRFGGIWKKPRVVKKGLEGKRIEGKRGTNVFSKREEEEKEG